MNAGNADTQASHPSSNKVLRIIAALKFIKVAALVSGGIAALKLLNPATLDQLSSWVEALSSPGARDFAQKTLDHLSGLTPRRIEGLGAGAFLLAAIYLTEGIGLWMAKRWAEWLSVVATSLFIPLELYELWEKASSSKATALALNILIVAYLVYRIKAPKQTAAGVSSKGMEGAARFGK